MKLKKPPLLPSLLTVIGVAILCTLGNWQVQRLEWKQGILAKIELQDLSAPLTALKLDENIDYNYSRAALKGRYDFSKQILIKPATHNKEIGAYVHTPLILKDGTTILVNRGFVPQGWTPPSTKSRQIKAQGLLRTPPRPNAFTPNNNPLENDWYYVKLNEIEKAKELQKLHPYILYLEEDNLKTETPIPTGFPKPKNNHLQYAIFWFTMAGILLIIFALRFLRA